MHLYNEYIMFIIKVKEKQDFMNVHFPENVGREATGENMYG